MGCKSSLCFGRVVAQFELIEYDLIELVTVSDEKDLCVRSRQETVREEVEQRFDYCLKEPEFKQDYV